ncbi:hypothetical protein E2C01_050013 [Portunus trituberculatus]|uniref:Uncharacterized protein n=1 Tax=Portunus trituberculatus TaxID=210409 RepID=A0A5B7GFE2_PORTR|nr:hypothetical protein [Portunus trituberculatus]
MLCNSRASTTAMRPHSHRSPALTPHTTCKTLRLRHAVQTVLIEHYYTTDTQPPTPALRALGRLTTSRLPTDL